MPENDRDAGLRTAQARIAKLEAENARLKAALKPFADSCATRAILSGDYSYMQERIVDWFGPSDFRAAAAALPKPKGEVKTVHGGRDAD
jgi:hypothetical protein